MGFGKAKGFVNFADDYTKEKWVGCACVYTPNCLTEHALSVTCPNGGKGLLRKAKREMAEEVSSVVAKQMLLHDVDIDSDMVDIDAEFEGNVGSG